MAFDIDPTVSPVFKFLDLLSTWDYDIPINTQWSVAIAPEMSRSGNIGEFFNLIGTYTEVDLINSAIPSSAMARVLSDTTQPPVDGIGLYYAQKFMLPNESFAISDSGTSGMGGYLKGTAGSDRMSFAERTVKLGFLETNLDFVDSFIKPWIVASSYRGLIDYGPDNSLKADIFIEQYTKNSSEELRPLRKYHWFQGCMPISMDSIECDQEKDDIIIRDVTFTYHTYKVQVFPDPFR